ncbi:MAG: hypothetical protein WC030_03130 [Candidatus Paceibacterota bacterium]
MTSRYDNEADALSPTSSLSGGLALGLGLIAILSWYDLVRGARQCERVNAASIQSRSKECSRVAGNTNGSFTCKAAENPYGPPTSYEVFWLKTISVCTIKS